MSTASRFMLSSLHTRVIVQRVRLSNSGAVCTGCRRPGCPVPPGGVFSGICSKGHLFPVGHDLHIFFARSLLIVDSRPVFITCAVCSAIAPKTDEFDHSAPPYTVCASAADWWGVHWLLRCPLGDPVFVVLIVPTTCMEPSYTSPCLSRMYLRNEYILTSLLSLLDMINRMGVNGQRDLIPRSEGGYTYGRELTEDMVRKHIRA